MYKTTLLKLLAPLFIVLFGMQFGFSQTHIYEHFGVDEGLPSSEVYDIYQDKLGYVWFATDKGLSRYNGYEFENFTTEDGLPDNTIFDFYPQENGQVWCYGYHSQSLFYFDEIFNGFKLYKHNDALKENLNSISIVKSLKVDRSENLFIGGHHIYGYIKITNQGYLTKHYNLKTNINKPKENNNVHIGFDKNKGLFFLVYNDNYKSNSNITIFTPENTPSSRIDVIELNNENNVLIDKKLAVLSKNKTVNYFETERNPTGIKRINDNKFFVGYYGNGAEIRDASGRIFQRFLLNKSVTGFLIDSEYGYWFSTLDDGVFYIKNPKFKILTKDHISSLVKNNGNKLFAGYHNGDLVSIHNEEFNLLYKGLNTDDAIVEYNASTGEVYGYSDGKIISYMSNKKLYNLGSRKLPEHIEDGLVSTYGLGFHTIENDSLIVNKSNQNLQDACKYNDEVLLGTSFGLYSYKNGKTSKKLSTKLFSRRIDDIDLNKGTNTIYMATQGAGVVVYGDSIYNITKAQGLTNDVVSEVHIENDSTVWACTNSGLNRITFNNDKSYSVTSITKTDGLLSNDIDDVEIINDTIWVATKKGLCYFQKSVLEEKENSNVLSLSLKGVDVNDKRVYKNNIILSYSENNINFNIEAISHKYTDNLNYLYRLKKVDTSWTSTKNRIISFPSLSPGNYTFEARANVLNNPNDLYVIYAFKIRPPFWESWWFYSLLVLAISGLVYLFFKVRVLSYNQDVFRELLRLAIKRLKRKEQFYKFKSNGEDFKIQTREIFYINSQGNYLDIITSKKTYTIRCKIGDFIATTPDSLEYLRVHRSYVIRIDKVSSKGKNWVVIKDTKIPVGETYLSELDKIQF